MIDLKFDFFGADLSVIQDVLAFSGVLTARWKVNFVLLNSYWCSFDVKVIAM